MKKQMNKLPFETVFFEDMGYCLSELIYKKHKIIIPEAVKDDIITDKHNIDVDIDTLGKKGLEDFKLIQKCRIESTADCHLCDFKLPTIPSVCSEIIASWGDARMFIDKHIDDYPFVKNCMFSPKDCGKTIFEDGKSALEALKSSNRTRETTIGNHIVMKQKRSILNEFRCFYICDKLRAVITKTEVDEKNQESILNFFKKYKYDIPFHTCCIELAMSEFGLEVIEINSFGPDLICDPAPFEWSQDWLELYTTETVIFKNIN